MNKKERRLALRTALASQADSLVVVETFSDQFSRPNTKELAQALGRWGAEPGKRVLLVLDVIPENVYLSGRNIPTLKTITGRYAQYLRCAASRHHCDNGNGPRQNSGGLR